MKKLLVSLLAAMHVVTTKSTVTVLTGVTMLALLLMARSVNWSPPKCGPPRTVHGRI